MKKQCYMKYMLLKAMTLYVLATLLISFPYMALAMAPPFGVNVNGASTYPENNGNAVTLDVQAEQMDGPKGKVTVTAFSQGVPASEAFYRNSVKRCVVISGVLPPFGGEMQGMPSGQMGAMPGMPPPPLMDMSAPEVNLSYDSNQQALTGTFSVNSPGAYTIRVELNDGQTTAVGSANAQFPLQRKDAESVFIEVGNGEETTASLAKLLGWEGLNLTIQSVEILQSSGAAEINRTASGNAINSLSIKGTRAGTIQALANVIYNGQQDTARITVQVKGGIPPIPLPNGKLPLVILLALLLTSFAALIYLNFFKRLQGAFVARCECGATKFPMELKAPHGRSFTLYQLLDKMLKRQVGNHEADIIRGIVNDSDNKKNLGQIRVYISKGDDKRPHYVFSKAGSPETVLDDTMKKAYPDSGNRNSKLTVNLSFIAQWNGVKR